MYSDGQHELLRHRRQFKRLSRAIGVNKWGRAFTEEIDAFWYAIFGDAASQNDQFWTDLWDPDGSEPNFHLPQSGAETVTFFSDNAADSAAGTGCQQIRIWGITDWDTPEVSEDLELNGPSGATTANAYHVINRVIAIRFGSGGAIADDYVFGDRDGDGQRMAVIYSSVAQTEQAFYAIPSVQTAFVTQIHGGKQRPFDPSQAEKGFILYRLLVHYNPDDNPGTTGTPTDKTTGVVEWYNKTLTDGSNPFRQKMTPIRIPGPALIRLQWCTAFGVSPFGGFDLYLVDN